MKKYTKEKGHNLFNLNEIDNIDKNKLGQEVYIPINFQPDDLKAEYAKKYGDSNKTISPLKIFNSLILKIPRTVTSLNIYGSLLQLDPWQKLSFNILPVNIQRINLSLKNLDIYLDNNEYIPNLLKSIPNHVKTVDLSDTNLFSINNADSILSAIPKTVKTITLPSCEFKNINQENIYKILGNIGLDTKIEYKKETDPKLKCIYDAHNIWYELNLKTNTNHTSFEKIIKKYTDSGDNLSELLLNINKFSDIYNFPNKNVLNQLTTEKLKNLKNATPDTYKVLSINLSKNPAHDSVLGLIGLDYRITHYHPETSVDAYKYDAHNLLHDIYKDIKNGSIVFDHIILKKGYIQSPTILLGLFEQITNMIPRHNTANLAIAMLLSVNATGYGIKSFKNEEMSYEELQSRYDVILSHLNLAVTNDPTLALSIINITKLMIEDIKSATENGIHYDPTIDRIIRKITGFNQKLISNKTDEVILPFKENDEYKYVTFLYPSLLSYSSLLHQDKTHGELIQHALGVKHIGYPHEGDDYYCKLYIQGTDLTSF